MPSSSSDSASTCAYSPTLFRPRDEDVYTVYGCLLRILPSEIVNAIIDEAEYWPRQTARYTKSDRPTWVYLTTPSVPQMLLENSVKKVVFWIRNNYTVQSYAPHERTQRSTEYSAFIQRSRDLSEEGLSEEGRFQILRAREVVRRRNRRPPTEIELKAAHIRLVPNPADGNVMWPIVDTYSNTGEWHKVDWRRDNDSNGGDDEEEAEQVKGASFVQSILPGDRIGVLAKAHFYGWVNTVEEVIVEVFYSV